MFARDWGRKMWEETALMGVGLHLGFKTVLEFVSDDG